MSLNQSLLGELKHEAANTKKILEKVPEDKFDWKPHEKSMSLGKLATHISELVGWLHMTLTTDELDFAKGTYKPMIAKSSQELLEIFQKNLDKSTQTLTAITDEEMMKHWKMRSGEHIIVDLPRIVVVRSVVMNHIIHHRGQLSVYLRLLNVPVPGLYGPSADEQFN